MAIVALIREMLKSSLLGRIPIVFLLIGILSLLLSIVYESPTVAFIGLGLAFWGALFLLLKPVKYVEGSLLSSSTIWSYSTIDRILKEIGCKGAGYHIPPILMDVYLPHHLEGLKDNVVFVSSNDDVKMPSIEDMAQGRLFIQNPKGVLLNSPGSGLLSQIEMLLKIDFAKTQLSQLCEILPRSISEDFNLAEEMKMDFEENHVRMKIRDSLYQNLYSSENDLKSIQILGCPLVSAVACAVAKASGKLVSIEKQKISPDGLTIEVWCRIT